MNGRGRHAGGGAGRFSVPGLSARRDRPPGRLRSVLQAGDANPALRLCITGLVACAVTLTGIAAAMIAGHQVSRGPAQLASGATVSPAPRSTVIANAVPALTGGGPGGWLLGGITAASRHADARLVLTAADRRDCPADAVACVDLTRHITWLQSGGKVSFGPVPMEPGKPGGKHQTPRGTFHVAWKAGPSYVSNIYHSPMPWATFFATGGIAFHGGSLTQWSHGCVHLTTKNAHYYNKHLPIGAEVVVF
jgi:L,D-transpeptidase-like protein